MEARKRKKYHEKSLSSSLYGEAADLEADSFTHLLFLMCPVGGEGYMAK